MKQFLSLVLIAATTCAFAQPKKAPKMAPVLAPGYYVGAKKDTVRGEIQTNPEDETEMYRQFSFKPLKAGGKVVVISPTKAKAYGYDEKHYIQLEEGGELIYLERLAEGRINLFKYRFNGKIDGYPAIESAYYIQDTRGEGDDAGLKDIKKISTKFYKRDVKPYLKDQPMIWSDLDKFTFDENALVNAVKEFNKFYVISGN